MDAWMKLFIQAVESAFPGRVDFIGLQGSAGRGEAGPDSDIDVVVILDTLSFDDLRRYEAAIAPLPRRGKICGFAAGRAQLYAWDEAELFQFCRDTTPFVGSLDALAARISPACVRRAVHTGACGLYHACVHNAVHEKEKTILYNLYKQARFVLQAKHWCEQGVYLRTRGELAQALTGADRAVLCRGAAGPGELELEADSRLLLEWAGALVEAWAPNG